MANKKINELLSRTPSLSDLMLVGDPSSGYSYKCTVTALATIIETDIADGYVTLTTTQTISGAKTFSNVLTLTSVANATTTQTKFLTLNGSNVVNYRTGAEVLADIGGASSSSISGTTNYVAKFTSSSAIGNSLIFDNGTNVGISTTSPSYKLDVNGTLRSTDSSYFATSSGNIGIGTNSVTGIGGPILHIHAPTYPEIHLTNSTTGDQYQDGTSIHVNGSSLNILNYESGSINLSTSGTQRVSIASDGNITLSVIANATTDTDKFLVSDSGVIKYRTGAELLSDIGGASSTAISGTTNYIPKFTSATAIGNSVIYESSSNIGIGITSPSARLHVNGTGNFTGGVYMAEAYLSSPNSIVGIVDSTNANGGFLQFSTSSTVIAEMGASQSVIGSGGNDLFVINGKGARDLILATNATERVRIASTGAVTLSTIANATTDTDKFLVSDSGVIKYRTGAELLSDIGGASSASVSGTTNYIPKFTSSSAIGNSQIIDNTNILINRTSSFASGTYTGQKLQVTGGIGINSDGADGVSRLTLLGNSSTGDGTIDWGGNGNFNLVFSNNGSERMRLDASGNLGIGVSNPSYQLTVNTTGYFGGTLTLGGGSRLSAVSGNALNFNTNSTDRMTLDASGNLGLGVTPSAWFANTLATEIGPFALYSRTDIVNDAGLMLNAYRNASASYIYKQNGYASNYQQGNGSHYWYTAPSGVAGNAISFTQAMTLDASGRLGIGTSSPAYKLDVAGTGGFSGAITSSLSSGIFLDNSAGGTNATQIRIKNTGGDVRIGVESSAGQTIQLGTSPYAAVFGNQGNYPVQFTTNGTTRMTLDASGNLGLGVTPANWLSNFRVLQIGNSNSTAFLYGRSDATIESAWGINAFYQSSTSDWRYANNGFASNLLQVNGEYRFFTAPSGTAGNTISFTQAMTLDASGRLGIGTSNPKSYSSLTTNGQIISLNNIGIDVGQSYRLNNYYNSGTGTDRTISTGYSAGIGLDQSGGGLTFSTSSSSVTADNNVTVTERMRITSGGNVLVGGTSNATGSPTLYIQSKAGAIANIGGWNFGGTSSADNSNNNLLTSGAYYNGTNLIATQTEATNYQQFQGNHIFYTNTGLTVGNAFSNTERMRITSGGNVGIGTSSPNQKLHISGITKIAPTTSASNGVATLILSNDFDNDNAIKHTSDKALSFETSGAERMRITSGGELLINTTSDAGDYKLQVNGKSLFSDKFNVSMNLSDYTATFVNNNSSSYGLYIQAGGTNSAMDIYNYNATTLLYTLSGTGNATFSGSIKTAAPSGFTAQPWKLGDVTVTSITVDTDKYISVDINGTVYNIPTCHPN